MLAKINAYIFALCLITAFAESAYAQQALYKWVDEEGVVHFSEEPPDESPKVKVEVFTTDAAPPYVPSAKTAVEVPSAPVSDAKNQRTRPAIQEISEAESIDISKMSLADLEQRCEDAREELIAPLRAIEIETCKQDRRNPPDYCESYWADYGAAAFAGDA